MIYFLRSSQSISRFEIIFLTYSLLSLRSFTNATSESIAPGTDFMIVFRLSPSFGIIISRNTVIIAINSSMDNTRATGRLIFSNIGFTVFPFLGWKRWRSIAFSGTFRKNVKHTAAIKGIMT